jgi:hypothetical protein
LGETGRSRKQLDTSRNLVKNIYPCCGGSLVFSITSICNYKMLLATQLFALEVVRSFVCLFACLYMNEFKPRIPCFHSPIQYPTPRPARVLLQVDCPPAHSSPPRVHTRQTTKQAFNKMQPAVDEAFLSPFASAVPDCGDGGAPIARPCFNGSELRAAALITAKQQ